jgi:hypothetical protein
MYSCVAVTVEWNYKCHVIMFRFRTWLLILIFILSVFEFHFFWKLITIKVIRLELNTKNLITSLSIIINYQLVRKFFVVQK